MTQVYDRVDAILRQAIASVQDCINANAQGRSLESEVFAMQALAYLESAYAIAPKRTREIIPDFDAKMQAMRHHIDEEKKKQRLKSMVTGDDELDRMARQEASRQEASRQEVSRQEASRQK